MAAILPGPDSGGQLFGMVGVIGGPPYPTLWLPVVAAALVAVVSGRRLRRPDRAARG
ncbi:hypothetical protein ACIGXM_30835 [Kitasatospora sp. NPDC052896]|uniref:hypothetical protein n=1 Tax=Kitasatospora sp. NPDC052896 TaxID=3364061 RepID=UPI0037CB3699